MNHTYLCVNFGLKPLDLLSRYSAFCRFPAECATKRNYIVDLWVVLVVAPVRLNCYIQISSSSLSQSSITTKHLFSLLLIHIV
jgi:hypothetical protein